jgi:hypothetical protein
MRLELAGQKKTAATLPWSTYAAVAAPKADACHLGCFQGICLYQAHVIQLHCRSDTEGASSAVLRNAAVITVPRRHSRYYACK